MAIVPYTNMNSILKNAIYLTTSKPGLLYLKVLVCDWSFVVIAYDTGTFILYCRLRMLECDQSWSLLISSCEEMVAVLEGAC